MRLNEFVNNDLKEKFELLCNKLYYDTAHFSAPHQIVETDSYKEVISLGDKILPLLMDKIILEKSYLMAYFLLCQDISGGIEISEKNRGYLNLVAEDYKKWWTKNKHRYGK